MSTRKADKPVAQTSRRAAPVVLPETRQTTPSAAEVQATAHLPVRETMGATAVKRTGGHTSPWLLAAYTTVALSVLLVTFIVVNGLRGDTGACFGGSLPCGSAAPDFALPAVPGGKVVRLSDFRGHPVLLELFATWCPACHAEAPSLEQIDATNRKRGLVVLSVVASAGDHTSDGDQHGPFTSPSDLLWFINTYNVHHTVLYDPQVASARRSQAAIYHEHGFPTLYLIDGQGTIRWAAVGVISAPDLQNEINRVLA